MNKALADLLNKADPGFVVFAHMMPTRIFRISASENFCTFRVEQLTLTNSDRLTPKGSWRTLSTHGSDAPGAKLAETFLVAQKAQNAFVAKMQKRMASR